MLLVLYKLGKYRWGEKKGPQPRPSYMWLWKLRSCLYGIYILNILKLKYTTKNLKNQYFKSVKMKWWLLLKTRQIWILHNLTDLKFFFKKTFLLFLPFLNISWVLKCSWKIIFFNFQDSQPWLGNFPVLNKKW